MNWLVQLVVMLFRSFFKERVATKAHEAVGAAKYKAKEAEASNAAITTATKARDGQLSLDLQFPDKLRDGSDPDCRDC